MIVQHSSGVCPLALSGIHNLWKHSSRHNFGPIFTKLAKNMHLVKAWSCSNLVYLGSKGK